ncbi:MAG TPA: glycosyltransferase [Microbacterium sp.]|nr:glycosyltransferase [Microbacterium sp.]
MSPELTESLPTRHVKIGSDVTEAARSIRVASVPANHVYVEHLAPVVALVGAARVERMPDPDPDDPGRSTVSRWWPPAMLEPSWVRAHPEFDIMHVQFGFDTRTPAQLTELVAALRDTGRPLVYTAHDLRNPHHDTRNAHDAQLDVLVPAADAVITLTRGAADEIHRRWGVKALVLPHPHVVDFETMRRVADRRRHRSLDRPFRVGVHVKSLRASMNPLSVIRVLAEAVKGYPNAVLQVNGHCDVLRSDGARYNRALAEFLDDTAARGLLELHVHDFLDDQALWTYLASLDVSVLPYRFGTHSGWLEACRDLGTAIVAPSCGYYRDQGPVFEYGHDEDGLDEASLRDALARAYHAPRSATVSVRDRYLQRQSVAAAHVLLYEGLRS